MLSSYRITKYNPSNRDIKGFYKNNTEWTSIYDFNNSNIKDYIYIENLYINVVKKIMKINNVNFLTIKYYQEKDNYENIKFKEGINKKKYKKLNDNLIVNIDYIPTLVRSLLRENIWCKLVGDRNFFIHFSYDLYMYIGFKHSKKIEAKIKKIDIENIYIEKFRSPYLKKL